MWLCVDVWWKQRADRLANKSARIFFFTYIHIVHNWTYSLWSILCMFDAKKKWKKERGREAGRVESEKKLERAYIFPFLIYASHVCVPRWVWITISQSWSSSLSLSSLVFFYCCRVEIVWLKCVMRQHLSFAMYLLLNMYVYWRRPYSQSEHY